MENIFFLTNNNFLIASNLENGNILYSYNIEDYYLKSFLKKKIQF